MKGIKIIATHEELFLKAAQALNLSVIKLSKIRMEGLVFYRVNSRFSQDDLFRLGIEFEKLVVNG